MGAVLQVEGLVQGEVLRGLAGDVRLWSSVCGAFSLGEGSSVRDPMCKGPSLLGSIFGGSVCLGFCPRGCSVCLGWGTV